MLRKIPFSFFIVLPFFFGCASLTDIHDYAASSVVALNKMDTINYTFSDYCRQDCELQQMRIGEIQSVFNCNCQEAAANADDAIQKIHHTMTAYLKAVAQLSNNKDFSYNVTGLTAALQKSTLLQLNDQQLAVSNKAGNFIATAATTLYRRKKLKQYLGEADTTFRDLTETFIYLIDKRLRGQLQFAYDAHIPNIKQMVDNTSDKGMKQLFVKLYLDEKAYYNKHIALIDAYVAVLKSVQKGYHEMYIHRYNLKDEGLKDLVKHYSQDLQYIVSSVK